MTRPILCLAARILVFEALMFWVPEWGAGGGQRRRPTTRGIDKGKKRRRVP